MAKLHFRNVNKIYSNNVQAVFDFNMDIDDKEFVVFVGPSGCGKSTTLRMVAGLEEITSGEIYIDDVLINDVPPKDRNISMVFQNYALYPHMTVFDNMAFSLQLRKELFPVYELQNPEEYDHEVEQIEQKYSELQKKGVANLKAKKAIKEEIKDFTYRNRLARDKEISEARKKYLVRVMTYDHEKVDELQKRIDSYLTEEEKKELNEKSAELKIELGKRINKLNFALESLGDTPKDELRRESLLRRLKVTKINFEDEITKLDKKIAESITAEERDKLIEEIIKIKKVFDKPAFEYRRFSKDEITEKVVDVSRTIGLEQYLKRKPAALSGGQRQRVALGRAIVRNPKVFLMDEPLSNLDAKLRVQMRTEIAKLQQNLGVTMIYVTHDQTEAMTMADRIVVMKDGYIQQIGTPKELFNSPNNLFVAGFIGSPSMNFIPGKFNGEEFLFDESDIKIKLDKDHLNLLKNYVDKEIILGVRPENIVFEDDKTKTHLSNSFALTCDISELLGNELIIYNYVGETKVLVKTSMVDDLNTGDIKQYRLDLDRIHFFDKETTERIR